MSPKQLPTPRFMIVLDSWGLTALRTIPLVGDQLADLFKSAVIPRVAGPRDRFLWALARLLGNRPPSNGPAPAPQPGGQEAHR